MSKQPLVVLKFGGSVLLDENRLRIAVHEIYRWRREGNRVLAVVSALAGRTEELIARCDALSPDASPAAKAAYIASGELESAALLGIHLDRAGIPARVLTPAAVGLLAVGDALDASPVSVDRALLDRALDEDGVVVFPGFVGVDAGGALVTLGRGGSDLTAVYLASALGADRCCLVKDVDGLYEHDPAASGPRPRRFTYAGYDDAAATDGSIIQHKAIRFAEGCGLEFELGRFNGTRPTRIGTGASTLDQTPDAPAVLDVALCGLGTVGGGVLELASQLPELFRLSGAACRDPGRHAAEAEAAGGLWTDAVDLAGSGADVVVEVIGGEEVAREVTVRALGCGARVVSANKALLASCGEELELLAASTGSSIRASASVGGVVPILEALAGRAVTAVRGVLNGTGNFVLGAVAKGASLEQAVADAQRLGFAEADPSRDLDGRDSLDKLLVIARSLGWSIDPANITLDGITDESIRSAGGRIKHVATLTPTHARVRVESLEPGDPLESLENEWNSAVLTLEDGSSIVVRGKGAGRWPTSESVFADLLECSRERTHQQAFMEETCV